MAIVELKNVSRVYTSGDHELKALDDVNLSLDEGKFVVILGPSGAGKSTLLNLLGGLDSPTSGTITVCGKDISTLTQNELADYRAETVGFVFQFYNLIPTLTVHENVTLVKEIVKNPLSATKMLEEVGLADHAKNFPSELSGGVTNIPCSLLPVYFVGGNGFFLIFRRNYFPVFNVNNGVCHFRYVLIMSNYNDGFTVFARHFKKKFQYKHAGCGIERARRLVA